MTDSVQLNLIDPPPADTNPRPVNPAHVEELTRSLLSLGLLNPIHVTPTGDRYTLIAGQHRLAAARALGWTTIPAIVSQRTPAIAAAIAAAENIARHNLSPVEEAVALAPLVEMHTDGTIGVARDLGRTQTWVEDRLEILTWPEDLINALARRLIPLGAARHLARIPNPELRSLRIRDAALHGINTRTAALWYQDSLRVDAPEEPPPDFSDPQHNLEIETTTRIRCFACRELTELSNLKTYNICTRCILELTQPPADQQPHNNTPTQSPTPPTPRPTNKQP
jgi:ParB/RepB/Spo0J family partition protein